MELLTTDEALKYLEDVLGIPATEAPNVSDKSVSSSTKLSFLEKLIRAFLEREPFQSICLMSHDVDKRARPSWNEIKHDLLLGRGGLCYWLNSFMYALLSALGFDSSLTYSTYDVGKYSPNNHLIVLLRDVVSPGSLHLVDVGLGYFVPRAVSLDFTRESEEFTDSFMTYKFQRESDTEMYMLKRVAQSPAAASSAINVEEGKNQQRGQHIKTGKEDGDKNLQDNLLVIKQTINEEGNQQKDAEKSIISNECDQKININHSTASPGNQQQDEVTKQHTTVNGIQSNENSQQFTWIRLYVFNPSIALKSLEPFFQCFDECFTDVTRLSTHSSPRAMCWPGGRFLAVVNSNLIQELEPGKLTKTRIVDVVVSRKPQLALSNDSDVKIAPETDDNGSDNTSNKVSHGTVVNENDCVSKSKTSLPKTPETSENTTGNYNAEANCNGTDCFGIKNNTIQRQVQLSQLAPLLEAYAHYFPQIPTHLVQNSLKNWISTGTIFPMPAHLA